MTIWIFGTSVSAQKGGWTARLRQLVGEPVVNASVGDQTSIMGFIRLAQVLDQVKRGDIVIWEYALLDILLVDVFGEDDVLRAMLQAWHQAAKAGAHIVVVLVTPKRDLFSPSELELRIKAAANSCLLRLVDLRECFSAIEDPAGHYVDQRHLRLDSPVLDALAARVVAAIQDYARKPASSDADCGSPSFPLAEMSWSWISALEMNPKDVSRRENSFVSVSAARLRPGPEALQLPAHSRLICVVVVSEHTSGAVWCGHPYCAPASCALPSDLKYPFLLRSTRIPCVRGAIGSLRAMPEHALRRGAWSDYAMSSEVQVAPIEVVGVLTAR